MAHDRPCSGCLCADEQTRIMDLKVVKTDWLDPPTYSKEWGTKLNSMFSRFFFFGPNVCKCTFHFSDLCLRTTMLDYGSLLYVTSLHIKKKYSPRHTHYSGNFIVFYNVFFPLQLTTFAPSCLFWFIMDSASHDTGSVLALFYRAYFCLSDVKI